MKNEIKVFECKNGHKILSNTKNEKRLLRGNIVCGTCGSNFTEYKSASWSAEKHFVCDAGHLITICPFTNGHCNFSWGNKEEERLNIEYDPETLSKMLANNEVKCPVGSNRIICDTILHDLEGTNLSVPQICGIKTRVRVEDVWRKYKCPEPKLGSYDKNMQFHDTEFASRNKARVERLRQKRNSKAVGEVIKKATERDYRDGAKKPRKEDL